MQPVKIGEGLWTVAQPLRMLGLVDIGTRMTVVALRDGGVALISPIRYTPELGASIAALETGPGPTKVRALIAPNQFHHLFLESWQRALAEDEGVMTAAAPGLPRKVREVEFDKVLVDDPPALWAGTLEQHVVGGVPRMSEVVFFHPATRTLITTDLVFHLMDATGPTRLWAKATGSYRRVAFPKLLRMLVRDPRALRASIDRILAWDFDRIVVTHGSNIETRGHAQFEQAFNWM